MKSILQSLQHRLSLKLKRVTGLTVTGAMLVTPLVTLASAAPAHAQPLSLADQQFVDSTVAEAMQYGKQPGMSISITGPKGDYTKAYGLGNRAAKTPLSLDDHYRIGSVTKSFTSTAILMQVDKGKIKLTDTLDKYVSGVPKGNIITIRDMLMMRSGVHDYQADQMTMLLFALFPTWPYNTANALQSIRSHASEFAPGTKYQYTNSNFVLLGMILEKVTGKPVKSVLADDIIKPLGLTNTTFATTPAIPAPVAHGYGTNWLGMPADITAFNPNLFGAAGALLSTIGDMQKYGQSLRDGALLSPASRALRQQTFCSVPYSGEGPTAFGYGLGYVSFGSWLGHDGSVPGYGSAVFYEPNSGAVFAGMENTQTPNLQILSRVMERVGAHLYPGSMSNSQYPSC